MAEKLVLGGVSPIESSCKWIFLTLRNFTPILLLASHRRVLPCNKPSPVSALRPECLCNALRALRPSSLSFDDLRFFFFMGPCGGPWLSESLCDFSWGSWCFELCSGLCPGSRDVSILLPKFLKGASGTASSTVAFWTLTHDSAVLSSPLSPSILIRKRSWSTRERCSLNMARR